MQLNAIRGMSVERQVQYDTIIKLLILVKVAVKQPEQYFPFTMPFVVTLLYKAVTLVVVMHIAIRVCVFQDWRKVPAFPVIVLFSVLAFSALLVHHRIMDNSFAKAFYCSLNLLAQYRFLWDEAKAQGTIGVEKKGMRPQTCKHPN